MSLESLLNVEVQIQRTERPEDGLGGHIETPTTIATARARLAPLSASERQAGRREDAEVTHMVFFRSGTDVAKYDTLVAADGREFRVLAVRRPSAGRHLEAEAEEVQRGR